MRGKNYRKNDAHPLVKDMYDTAIRYAWQLIARHIAEARNLLD